MNLSTSQLPIYKMSVFGGGAIANICGVLLIEGKREENLLIETVNKLFELNDGLRIRLYRTENGHKQKIIPYEKRSIKVLHFSNREELYTYADLYAKEPMSLEKDLFEIQIFYLPDSFGIIPKMHHLIGDAWAYVLISTQFNSLLFNQMPEAYSFIDYVEKDKEYLSSKRFTKDTEFFNKKFSEFNEPIYMCASDSARFTAKRKTYIINETAKKILSYAEQTGISSFSLFFSVLSLYFSSIKNNAEKFCIGTTFLNRSGDVEKNTIASYANAVPVFVELDYSLSLLENIKNIQTSIMASMRHQKFNYQMILDSLESLSSEFKKPYDIIINYQNAKISGVFSNSLWLHNGMQLESLQIQIEDRDNEGFFKIHYDYQTEKFTEKDIESLHNHLCNLILDVIENPNKKISDLEMLSSSEKQKILLEFNETAHSYNIAENSTLYSLFEKTAKTNAGKICIKTARKSITYDDLLDISERLDTELRKITGGKKTVIAVIAERSVEMYSAIYGIIRGGNAYLPIDPSYPKERIDYILQDSNASAVVAQGKFAHLAQSIPHIDITTLTENLNNSSIDIPACAAESHDTAYVIYTSGSTGNPKGAKISHKSAINRILWMHDKYPLEADDFILQKTPYTFDVSVWELFWWGICGGSLAVSEPGEHFLPAKILEDVYKNNISHIHFVPSVFELFLNFLENNKSDQYKFNSVRYVFLSGEVLDADLIQRFYKLYDFKKVSLHNLYGPTECAVDVTYYDCSPTDIDPVPIGKPIYNTQMYVVDKHMKPVPIGVTGELCIAGANVGQGYLNKPELTAEKFIDNPFGEGKLYRTGDIACWREDGNIVFMGRSDFQVKINGQRIEIGEIEATIKSFDVVESVAVIVKKIDTRDMLVAFYSGKNVGSDVIKKFCFSKLPKYMVPSIIIHLEQLPLNQSGKLDRKSLANQEIKIVRSVKNEPPKNEAESFICNAFKAVLGKNNIFRNSDFFENGGTSLSMISLLSEKGFEEVSAAEFMREPTPAGLAQVFKEKTLNTFKYLESLYTPEFSESVLILLPFAGGGVETYSNFVSAFKKKNENMSIYFIRYLHTFEECKNAAREIALAFNNKKFYVYSHCVGSALALQIISLLEKENVSVKHYFAGASIPPLKPRENNIWNIVPDFFLKAILSKAGAKLTLLSNEQLNKLLGCFRDDTDFANISFARFSGRIMAPTSLIINKKDMFTKNYKQAEKIWSKYAERLNGICYIDSESHYFQSDESEELVRILYTIIQNI